MPVLGVPRAALSYDIDGGGPAVVQLHGLTSSRRRDRVLGLDVVGGIEGHRVLRYDARGHGESIGDPVADDYTWPRLADDLHALLDHVVGDEPVHGVGPSMGAATLLLAALTRPERFASLTLLIPPTAWGSRPAQRQSYLETADLVQSAGVEAWIDRDRVAARPPAIDPALPVTRPDVTDPLVPSVLRGAAASDLPPLTDLAAVTPPVLVLAWADDPGHPLATARPLADTLPSARLEVASTPVDVAAWHDAFVRHVTGAGQVSSGTA